MFSAVSFFTCFCLYCQHQQQATLLENKWTDLAQQCLPLPSQSCHCKPQNHQDRSGDGGSKLLDLDRLQAENQVEFEREKVVEAMRDQEYLGMNNPKKRVFGPLEKKLRFCFDWDNSDDTSRDMNALYEKPHEACLLFDRGFRAGIDRYEQKQLAAKNKEIQQGASLPQASSVWV